MAHAAPLPTPTPIALRFDGERQLPVLAFYCPGTGPTAWDRRCGSAPLGNFWPMPAPLRLEHRGANGTFYSAEAAYQALKWWAHVPTRAAFEACRATGVDGGEQAFTLKRWCEQPESEASRWLRAPTGAAADDAANFAGLGRFDAMLLVLRAKWRMPPLRRFLLSTGQALLVEHSPRPGRDPYWTDGCTGGGANRLGAALMLVRAELLVASADDAQAAAKSAAGVGWPEGVPRPSWAGGAPAEDVRWQAMVDAVAVRLCQTRWE